MLCENNLAAALCSGLVTDPLGNVASRRDLRRDVTFRRRLSRTHTHIHIHSRIPLHPQTLARTRAHRDATNHLWIARSHQRAASADRRDFFSLSASV